MVHLSQDGFLTELNKMMKNSKNKGSVNVTMKVLSKKPLPKSGSQSQSKKKPQSSSSSSSSDSGERECLIRARLGNKKISATVKSRDVIKFQQTLSVILRANMDGLKKRERNRKTKG
mmetsp:Transcript_29619/g.40906  ORF Transcript_29619/g.40906 Transcript_29619/m.40906 type:complete len:117 (-) Transcript_29619:219-569(-)